MPFLHTVRYPKGGRGGDVVRISRTILWKYEREARRKERTIRQHEPVAEFAYVPCTIAASEVQELDLPLNVGVIIQEKVNVDSTPPLPHTDRTSQTMLEVNRTFNVLQESNKRGHSCPGTNHNEWPRAQW